MLALVHLRLESSLAAMRTFTLSVRIAACLCAVVLLVAGLDAQVTLNPNPSRAIGHNWTVPKSTAPNLVEGREFNSPHAVAIDARANPPILYVSDLGNNRVLAWRNISSAREGAFADLVIGQRDKFSTWAWGPGTPAYRSGLTAPGGLTVDAQGNLYVVDTGNNRILRFPKPFEQPEDALIPDLVIGQTSLNTNAPNTGGLSASTIAVNTGSKLYRTALGFDGLGNLYFTDAGNHRVLRYPSHVLGTGAANGPAADIVLGQTDLGSNTPLKIDAPSQVNKNGLNSPGGLALSPTHVFVSDGLSRVLAYPLPSFIGQAASRILGYLPRIQGQPAPPAVNETEFSTPEGIIVIGGAPAVCDLGNNRILVFETVDKWPLEASEFSPKARWVIGQRDMFTRKASAGNNGLSGPVHGVFFNDELYVSDTYNHRVLVFPQQSASPPTFTTASRVAGQLGMDFNAVNLIEGKELFLTGALGARAGLAIDTKSAPPRLYIADTYNNRVLGFLDARKVKTGDRADLVIGQSDPYRSGINYPYSDATLLGDLGLFLPTGVVVDSNGDLFVADSGNARVLRFPRPFNQSGLQRANLVLGQSSFSIKVTDPSSRTTAAPYALAFTAGGHLLVSDSAHNRVLMFKRPQGGDFTNGQTAAAKIGQPDFTSVAPGQSAGGVPAPVNRFNGPRGISLDSSDRLYVADTGNSRVLIFGPVYALTADDPGPSAVLTLSGLRTPTDVFVSQATGEIWVADAGNNRALRYPHFDLLPARDYKFELSIPSAAPLAVWLDPYGNLLMADSYNRVAIYYPAAVASNAASFVTAFTRPLSPGVIASLFPMGVQFGTETKSFDQLPNPVPLPKTLADTQLLFNDEPAPLYFVSPGQINFLVPMRAPTSGNADVVVLRASTGQILASGPVPMGMASPALFTSSRTGTGLVAALNQDNSVNSAASAAGRGEVIQLFCTGQGFVEGAPPDGDMASGLTPTSEKPRVWIEGSSSDAQGYVPDENIQYSGLAPGLIGVWQINVKIPNQTAPGNRVIFLQMKSINSSPPRTQIAVR